MKKIINFEEKVWVPNDLEHETLRKQLQIPKKKNIPMSLLKRIRSAKIGNYIKNPTKAGKEYIKVTKLLKDRVNFALNVRKFKKESIDENFILFLMDEGVIDRYNNVKEWNRIQAEYLQKLFDEGIMAMDDFNAIMAFGAYFSDYYEYHDRLPSYEEAKVYMENVDLN